MDDRAMDGRALTLDLAAAAGVTADPDRLAPLFDLGPARAAWSPSPASAPAPVGEGGPALRVSVWTRDHAAAAAALARLAPELSDVREALAVEAGEAGEEGGFEGLGLSLRADGSARPRWWALAADGTQLAERVRTAWPAHAAEIERLLQAAGGPDACAAVGVAAAGSPGAALSSRLYVRLRDPAAALAVLELARVRASRAARLFWRGLVGLTHGDGARSGRSWPEVWAGRGLGAGGGWSFHYFAGGAERRLPDYALLDAAGAGPELLGCWQLLCAFGPGPWVQRVGLILPESGPPSLTASLARTGLELRGATGEATQSSESATPSLEEAPDLGLDRYRDEPLDDGDPPLLLDDLEESVAADVEAAAAAAAAAESESAAAAFDDPSHIEAMLATLGPAGFVENATRHAATVDAIYRKLQARSKILPIVERLPRGAQLGDGTTTSLRVWLATPASTEAECAKMFEQRFRMQLPDADSIDHASGRTGAGHQPPLTKSCLTRLWDVYEALPPSNIETDPQLLHILRDHNNSPGDACYAVPGTGEQGDILLAYDSLTTDIENIEYSGAGDSFDPDAGDPDAGDPDAGQGRELDRIYQAGGPTYCADALGTAAGTPAPDPARLDATLRDELRQLFDRGDAPLRAVPAAIACRCGARYAAEVAAGPLVPLHPDVRRQILSGTFHRYFCRACGMTTLIDAPRWFADLSRHQWHTVAPSAGLPWRGAWLAAERARFEAAMVTGAPALVASWGAEMTRRLLFGLAPLREKLVASDAGLDDRIIELLKLQLVRDLRARLSATDYFHLVSASADTLAFERTHPDGLIRRFRIPRMLYDALAMDPALPDLIELAFPDGLLIDHRALLVPEAAGAASEPAALR